MTLTPILQQEIDQLVTKQARHAIAVELNLLRRAQQFIRRGVLEGTFGLATAAGARAINRHRATGLTHLARQHFPRQHPAPGRLGWCLVNEHGPVCNNHAEPGSSYCHEHRAYEDIVRERY